MEIERFKSEVFQPFIKSNQLTIEQLPESARDATGRVSELEDKKTPYAIEVARKRKVEVVIEDADSPVQQGPGSNPPPSDQLTEKELKNFELNLKKLAVKNQTLSKTLKKIESSLGPIDVANRGKVIATNTALTILRESINQYLKGNQLTRRAKNLRLKESQDVIKRLELEQKNIERIVQELNYRK